MADNHDPYMDAYQRKLARIAAEYKQADADLARAQSEADQMLEDDAADRLVACELTTMAVNNMANRYWAAKNPPAPPPETIAKPLDRMGWGDVYDMCKRGSKYGVDDNSFQAGMAEVQRNPSRNRGG